MNRIITIALILINTALFAQYKKVSNPETLAAKLNSVSAKTKTIDSDFKQYKHLDILENDLESTGHFSFQIPGKVRWEYMHPYPYVIVMNKGNMLINDGKSTKKFDTKSNKMFKEINDLMLGMLQGKILNSTKFSVAFFENKHEILAKLMPKSPQLKEFLNEMQLFFDKKNYAVSKIKMIEDSGDYTFIKFINNKINSELPAQTFEIK